MKMTNDDGVLVGSLTEFMKEFPEMTEHEKSLVTFAWTEAFVLARSLKCGDAEWNRDFNTPSALS
jgi:hypothetical protein